MHEGLTHPKDATVNKNPYQLRAQRLNSLSNGFPPTPDGVELRLLTRLFSLEEAQLHRSLNLESVL